MIRNIRAWDAGENYADRITVKIEESNGTISYYGISDHNTGPNGFNMYIGTEGEIDESSCGESLDSIPLETVRGLLNRGI